MSEGGSPEFESQPNQTRLKLDAAAAWESVLKQKGERLHVGPVSSLGGDVFANLWCHTDTGYCL